MNLEPPDHSKQIPICLLKRVTMFIASIYKEGMYERSRCIKNNKLDRYLNKSNKYKKAK